MADEKDMFAARQERGRELLAALFSHVLALRERGRGGGGRIGVGSSDRGRETDDMNHHGTSAEDKQSVGGRKTKENKHDG